MAFIHTNYLTGNDTTGDGSTSLPYKTAGKALTVAVSNDFIKVAGGQWTAVAGTFTFTNSSITVDTSTSQVGIIAVNDILTFEDGQFGFDRFHVRVAAVTTTTLTLATAWSGTTQITSALYMINQFHYNTAANSISFETWLPGNVAPLGRTGITISGGWSSDYTAQNGWTMVRATQATPSQVFFANITAGALGAWENNLVFDRIFHCRINSLLATNNGDPNSFAIKECAIMRGTNDGVFVNSPNTRFGGLFNVDENTPVTMYVCPEGTISGQFTNINSINPSNPSRSSSTNITVYQQIGSATTGGLSAGYLTFGVSNTATQASPNKITMHTRSSYANIGGTGPFVPGYPAAYFNMIGTDGRGSFYLEKGNIYCNAASIVYINTLANNYTQIEDLEFVGPYGSVGNSIVIGFVGVALVDLSDEVKTIEQFNPAAGIGSANPASESVYPLQKLAQTNLSSTQVKDAEGLKNLDSFMNIYYKDPVNDWLRITGAGSWGYEVFNAVFEWSIWKMIGVKEKINTPFTVTVRLKTDDAVGVWSKIALQYGPNASQVIVQNITTTSSFADYYITVDPAAYPDWNQFIFPMYIGLSSKTWNTYSNNQQAPICYVQSINIS